MSCPRCGEPTNPNAAACAHCGVALPQSAQATDNTVLRPAMQPPPGAPPQPVAPPLSPREDPASLTQKGVLYSLFDVSFKSLVTTKLVRLLYILAMIWIGLTAVFYIFLGFHTSPVVGLLVLFILAPVISLFMLGMIRIALELCIGLFQIMANSNELVAQGRRNASS
ncbi:MAG: DUF4282 domain-containing protein [Solirubrobacteraceae bacterium]